MHQRCGEAGNILIYILGAIFLLGILIALLRGNFQEGTSVDSDKLALRVGEVRRHAGEIERGVQYVLRNGASEGDIKFAEPVDAATPYGDISVTPQFQVFSEQGGGATFRLPPPGVNDGTKWAYSSYTHFPGVGVDEPSQMRGDVVAILPNVTESFCTGVNMSVGHPLDLSEIADPNVDGCIYSPGYEFDGSYAEGALNNVLDTVVVTKSPAPELCIRCADGTFHYYRVVLSR